ncbi:MAG TPA: hypothetical protein VNW90_25185 [Acetobacteraceae bacterium]|jgi:hypothetical protein|nr:hypothetical protein [Acetobacteraceae bacterium]
MTPTPRKVRSGRRQFGPSPGTDQEWAKVMASPHVQRAFSDPAIQQALMQHMQQQAAAAPPAAPAPGMAQGGALHFDTGGANNATEIHDLERQIADLPEGEKKNSLRMRLATLQSQQSASPFSIPGGGTVSGSTMSGINQMVKPPTMGNTALAAGMGALMGAGTTSHQGLSALVGAGLSGALSYLIRKYGKNAQAQKDQQQSGGGGGYTGGYTPMQAPQGGATGSSTPAQPSVTLPTSGPTGGPQSVPGLDNVGALPSAPPGEGRLMMGTANSDSGNVISRDGGKTWVDSQTQKPYHDVVVNQTQIDPGSSLTSAAPATTPPAQTGLGSALAGSADTNTTTPNLMGPTFAAGQEKRLQQGLIPRGPAGAFAPGWDEKLGKNTLQGTTPTAAPTDSWFAGAPGDFGGEFGEATTPFQKGGPVASPEPLAHKMPIPVLHTTIVIAGKPKQDDKKPTKKAGGGVYPKTQLLPPKRGPQDHEDRPRAHGRVQVPRGSGVAIKGKRFGGIY